MKPRRELPHPRFKILENQQLTVHPHRAPLAGSDFPGTDNGGMPLSGGGGDEAGFRGRWEVLSQLGRGEDGIKD